MKTFVAVALMVVAGVAVAKDWGDAWNKISIKGKDAVTKTFQHDYDVGKTGSIEVNDFSGSVEVKAVDGGKVSLTHERRAASQHDFDCETLEVREDKGRLRISLERSRERSCHSIYATDKLTLSVPRNSDLTLASIGDSVTVNGVRSKIKLDSIGDSAILEGIRELDADSIGDTLRVALSELGEDGIRIDSVGDSVVLDLPSKVDARLRIDSVGDSIRGPGFKSHGDYETTLGKGGPTIRIGSVGDSVVIHGGEVRGTEY